MNKELVSVVMPVCNSRSDFLEQSLSSILDQTYDNLEATIVIDRYDNERDAQIFKTLDAFRDDHRIQIIVRSTRGYCSALNTGIMRSKGTFIARLDSDDFWIPCKIDEQMDRIDHSKTVLTGTWTNAIDEDSRKCGEIRPPVSCEKIRESILLHNPFVHSSIIFEKRIVNEIGLYRELFDGAEDYEFYLRVIARGYSCYNVPKFLTCLRESRNSIMRGSRWVKTRKSYLMAKYAAVMNLGYGNARDLLFTLGSIGTFLVTPRMGVCLKKAIGWYSPST